MLNKEKFIEYVENKLGQDYNVNYNGKNLKVGNSNFSVGMNTDTYTNKNDLLVKTYDNDYYFFSVINSIANKLDRYFKKFKD